MSFGLAVAMFAIVIPAELPDKTFIATLVLSSKYRPLPVWVGAAGGLVVQSLIGVVAGRLLALLPHRVVELVVAVVFFAGAAYLFSASQTSVEHHGEEIAAREEERLPGTGDAAVGAGPSAVRIGLTSFAVITAAEFGDLTQVLITNMTARTRDPVSVFVGAAAGLVVVSGFGVLLGRTITRVVPLSLVRRFSALVLVGLGVWSVLGAAGV